MNVQKNQKAKMPMRGLRGEETGPKNIASLVPQKERLEKRTESWARAGEVEALLLGSGAHLKESKSNRSGRKARIQLTGMKKYYRNPSTDLQKKNST